MTSSITFPALIIGLMSGTSADGVDAVFLTTDGQTMVQPGEGLFMPYSAQLRAQILALMQGEGDAPAVTRGLTEVHIAAVRALMQKTGLTPQLIGFHGQTIYHAPQKRITVQIGDAHYMADCLRIPVVHDFRSNDVRHGGQGAPLLPLYHAALAHALPKPLAVVNIGGVANVTWIGEASRPSEPSAREAALHGERSSVSREHPYILAFDCGPGNALLDDWMCEHTGQACDRDGATASRGKVDEAVVRTFLQHPFFAQKPPKSLDRHTFSRDGVRHLSLEDGAATLTAMTAASILHSLAALGSSPQRILITGGGRHNPTLMRMLKNYARSTAAEILPVEAVGWNGDMLEAEGFAYLAARCVRGLPLSLPTTTGVPQPLTGGVLVEPSANS